MGVVVGIEVGVAVIVLVVVDVGVMLGVGESSGGCVVGAEDGEQAVSRIKTIGVICRRLIISVLT